MKIYSIQNRLPVNSKGRFLKNNKEVLTNIIINPTKEAREKAELEMLKKIKEMGLVAIQTIKFVAKSK